MPLPGTGSFLDRQAERAGYKSGGIWRLCDFIWKSVRIAEDALCLQNLTWYTSGDWALVKRYNQGLCDALVRNYLSNVAKGKDIKPKIFFQGGVLAKYRHESFLWKNIRHRGYCPRHYSMMGCHRYITCKEQTEKIKITHFKALT